MAVLAEQNRPRHQGAVRRARRGPGPRSPADLPDQPLDLILPEILDGLEHLAQAAAAKQVKLDDWHRRYEANERRRERQARRAQDEADRWQAVRDLAADWDEADRARRFLAALEAQLPTAPDGEAVSEGLQWAWRKAEAFDPLSDANAASVRGLLERTLRRRGRTKD